LKSIFKQKLKVVELLKTARALTYEHKSSVDERCRENICYE